MKKIVYIILILPFLGFAQNLRKADQSYSLLNYEDAISRYEKQLSKQIDGSQKKVALKNLANSYYHIQQYDKARKYFMDLYDIQGNEMDKVDFVRLISALRSIGNYSLADQLFDDYFSEEEQVLKVKDFQKNKLENLESEYNKVVNLEINSPQSDFGVTLKGNQAIFSSAREREDAYLSIYQARINRNSGQLSSPTKFLENLNSDYHDATFTFAKEGNIVFFSRNYLTHKGKLNAKNNENAKVMIMRGVLEGDRITDVKPCEFNLKEYNSSHPFVTPDGKHLLFASDRPGGYGGSDIYVVELFNDGSTGEPINLGATINTPGAELFPSMVGDTLFFSSDFHYGLGGLDIFFSISKGYTNHSIPENLGKPINSTKDDFSFIRTQERTGYFSSNRDGGKGSDDIYWFDMVQLVTEINYSGLVLTKGDETPIPNASIQVFDLFDQMIMEENSDDEGKYNLLLPVNSQFRVVYSKEDYSKEEVKVFTPDKVEDKEGNHVWLTSFTSLVDKDENEVEKIKVNPIYFDLDKSDITPQAIVELSKIEYAMKTFPSIIIKIESHTDSRGADQYNLELSDRRAKATRDYLLSVGISPERIVSAIGYGESRLLNHCSNGVKCSDEEHSVNRRSDFIIVER